MKISSQKREENKVFLEVEEDYQSLEQATELAIVEAGKELKIPGFRKGKAPRDMIEKALNRAAVEAHAAQDLIGKLYPQIIDQAKIEPVDYPNVEIKQQKKGQPFVFTLSVHVYPEVKLGKYKGLKVEKKKVAITDEELQKVLENLRERFSAMTKEDKEKVTIDDEFAKKVSKYQTLAELKQELKATMLKDRESGAEADLKNNLITAAAAEASVDIPPAMIEREIDVMLDELRNSLARSGLTLEDYLKGIKKEEKIVRDEFHKSAEVRVRGKIVLRAIAESEQIKVGPEEIDEEIKKMAESSGQKMEDVQKNVDQVTKKFVEDYLLRKLALDFIVEKAKIKTPD